MKLEVFDKIITDWNENDAACFKKPIEELDVEIEEWTEIIVNQNEITIVFKGSDWIPNGKTNATTMAYWFNIKEKYFDNGGGFVTDDAPDVDWEACEAFYKKYATLESDFIDALDKGDFERAKRLNKADPERLKPSIQNSFYARWIVKSGNIEFLKWAKEVDDGISFGYNSRFENPLKIAIDYNHEDVAIWLIDNYPEVPLTEKYDKLYILKKAINNKMEKLTLKLIEIPEILNLVIELDAVEYLPTSIRDVFLF